MEETSGVEAAVVAILTGAVAGVLGAVVVSTMSPDPMLMIAGAFVAFVVVCALTVVAVGH